MLRGVWLNRTAEKFCSAVPGLPGGARGAGRKRLLCTQGAAHGLLLISEVPWLISGIGLCLKFNTSILRKNTHCYNVAYFCIAFIQIFWEIVFPAVNSKL